MKNRSAIAAAGKKFRTKNISKRVQKIVISPIKEMSILADQSGGNIVSFGQGIPYPDTPQNIKRAVLKALKTDEVARYTLEPGIPELRKLVARKYGANENEIMISVGAQEAMDCALASILDEGDEVLLPEPAYASHIEQVLQWGGKPVFVPLNPKGWKLDIAKLKKRLAKKTKAVLLSNPSNPTGAVLTKKEMGELANFVLRKKLILIADETYDFLTYVGIKHISFASLRNVRKQLIITGSFSKKYRMTGYRVGYAFADEGIIDHMLKVHDALTICAPAISQKAAIEALKGPQASVRELVKKLSYNRNLMCRELDKLSGYFEYQKPYGAYYIMVKYKFTKMNSFELALKILREAKVVIIPGAAFGPSGEGYLRFSFAGQPREIKKGFEKLNRWLKNF